MNNFSVSKAAFAGFGLLRKRPVAALVWTVVAFAFLVGQGVLCVVMAGEAFQVMNEMQTSGDMDMTSYMAVASETGTFSAVSTVLQIFVSTLLLSAVLRALLRPVEGGPAFIRLGAQELKLAVVVVVVGILTTLAWGVVFVIGLIATAILGGATRSGPIAGVVGGISLLLATATGLFFNIKFILAPPQTAHDKAIRIFESWTLTKGYFGKLLASMLLTLLVIVLAGGGLILLGILFAISQNEVHDPMQVMMYVTQPGFTMESMLSPARLVSTFAASLAWIIAMAFGLGLAASAYQQITGAEPVTSPISASLEDDDDDDDDDED